MSTKSPITKFVLFLLCSSFLIGFQSFVELRLRVYPIERENEVFLYADNGENFPISLELSYELDNMKTTNDNDIFIIPPKTTRILLNSFKKMDTLKEGKYDYCYKRYFGDITKADYNEEVIYSLPLPLKGSYLVGQGYNGNYTHHGKSAYALDFELAEGTKVHAARKGVVVRIVDDFNKGCPEAECFGQENYVLVYHKDNTFSIYAHLKQNTTAIKIGDSVSAGQFIAESGATGRVTGPHLHFEVFKWRFTGKGIEKVSLPVKFRINKKGKVGVPKEGSFYKRRY